MRFEDRLRSRMKAADADFPGSPLSWGPTAERAAKRRRMHTAMIVAAVASAVVLIAGTALLLSQDEGAPLPPVESPSPTPSPDLSPTPVARCSATGMSVPESDQTKLPPEAAAKRQAIIERALACDYKGLEEMADPNEFTFSFGVERGPARFWRTLERQGEPVMADLVRVLSLRPHRYPEFEMYGWPRVVRARASDADWQAVVDAGLITQRQADDLRAMNLGYIDRRAFITFDGRWTTFVAGD